MEIIVKKKKTKTEMESAMQIIAMEILNVKSEDETSLADD